MSTYKVVMAADFSGFRLKQAVKAQLIATGHDVTDLGPLQESDRLPYFEAAAAVAAAIQGGSHDRGILICGTGAGVSLIANKYKGIHCVACESIYTAKRISWINNANVLAMGERVVSYDMGSEMALAFLSGEWCDGFDDARRANNQRGFALLGNIEAKHFK